MPWLKIVFPCVAGGVERLESALEASGALAISSEDAADQPILEPAPGATPLWARTCVSALYAYDADAERVLAGLRAMLGGDGLPPHRIEALPDRAWERAWLEHARPLRFGARLRVCPGDTEPAPDGAVEPPVVVRLDPGLAFGAGTHASTALCLEWLAASEVAGAEVLDYGCGSGILAIAALKLGAARATAVDIDPQAREAARANGRRNGVLRALTVTDSLPDPFRCDVLIANVIASVLVELAERLAGAIAPRGRLVLAGILDHEAGVVADAYRTWFDMDAPRRCGEWIRLDGIRRG